MNIINKEEFTYAKELITKYQEHFSKYNNLEYIENIWLNEMNLINNNTNNQESEIIKKIIIDEYDYNYYIFKEEIYFILDNIKVPPLILNKKWGFTFYIYTDKYVYYSFGTTNKYNKYFTKLPIV